MKSKAQSKGMNLEVLEDSQSLFTPIETVPLLPESAPESAPTLEAAIPPEEASLCDKDSRYHDMSDVPSHMLFYPWKRMSIRPFNIKDLIKLSGSVSTQNLKALIESVGASLDRSVWNVTTGDFWFIMFWLRLNSYQRTPLVVDWICQDPEHNLEVRLGNMDAESLKNQKVIDKSELVIYEIDVEKCHELCKKVHAEFGVYLYAQTMADFNVMTQMMTDKTLKQEDLWLFKYASYLNPAKHGIKLLERVEYIKKNWEEHERGVELFEYIQEWTTVSHHGVEEYVQSTCRGCKGHTRVNLELEALTFFPLV